MVSKRSTHEIAKLLEEVVAALREMPDIPLSTLRSLRPKKAKASVRVTQLASTLRRLNRNEAELRLNELGQKQLIQLCKQLKVHIGSKRTKPNLIQQILWQFFEATDELERIRTYEEKPSRENTA